MITMKFSQALLLCNEACLSCFWASERKACLETSKLRYKVFKNSKLISWYLPDYSRSYKPLENMDSTTFLFKFWVEHFSLLKTLRTNRKIFSIMSLSNDIHKLNVGVLTGTDLEVVFWKYNRTRLWNALILEIYDIAICKWRNVYKQHLTILWTSLSLVARSLLKW